MRLALILFCVLILAVSMAGRTHAFEPERPGPSSDPWQPGWLKRDIWGEPANPEIRARLQRHSAFMYMGVPAAYQAAKPPEPATAAQIRAGRKLYRAHCAECHGKDGMGDGDAAKGLSPSPALLAYFIQTRAASVDTYLLWTIADGGAQFDTAMPAFKDRLAQDEMWRIIAYLRAGLPR